MRPRWIVSAGLTACLALNLAMTAPSPPPPAAAPEPLSDMPEVFARDGALNVTLEARETITAFDGIGIKTIVYNDNFSGPVLRAHPGDTMRIRLVNRLPQPTNLHFHGMQGSPLGNGDNVHLSVPPGQSFDYEIKIPVYQPPGAYWYHAHEHGVSEKQVGGGLSGPLMIEGFTGRIPGLENVRERLFAFKSIEVEDSDDPVVNDEWHGVVQTINGHTTVTETIRPGETVLWHLTNHDPNQTVHLTLEGHRFTVIGQDGAAIAHAYEQDVLDIMPASRLEVLVTGGASGVYRLLTRNVLTGKGSALSRNRIVGHVAVTGSQAVPATFTLPDLQDLSGLTVNGYRTLVYTQSKDAEKYYINGRLFDAARTDVRVNLGDVEDWTIRNESDDMHSFHIHQLAFQVMAMNGTKVPFNGLLDTVRVPEHGDVTVRLAFLKPAIVGSFMFHCHVLKHEDKGMMQTIEVVDPKAVRHASAGNGGVVAWLTGLLRADMAVFDHPPICSAWSAG